MTTRHLLAFAGFLCVAASVRGPAEAQAPLLSDAPASTALSPGKESVVPGIKLPTSLPPNTGLFPSLGEALQDNGIDLHGSILDIFLANPNAGAEPGHTSNFGAVSVAADVDLRKLADLPGIVHFSETLYVLRSNMPGMIVDVGSSLGGYQTTPVVSANTLNVLTYESDLLNGRLSLEAGKTNLYNYFFLPNGLDPLNYFSTVLNLDGNFLPVVWPIWGGRATYKLDGGWFLQGGAFEDNYEDSRRNGFHWGDAGAAGVQLLAEIDYRSEFATEHYPANLELGVYYDTSPGGANVKGTIFPSTQGTSPATYPGGGAVYVQGKKVIWRAAHSAGPIPENVAVYGSLNVAYDKPQPIDLDGIAGVNVTGFIPGRPSDAVGLQVHYSRLSGIEQKYETETETAAGSLGTPVPRNGFAFELVGEAAIGHGIAFHPLAEYFTATDNYNDSFQPNRPHDGFICGAFLTVALGPLLGTSQKPF